MDSITLRSQYGKKYRSVIGGFWPQHYFYISMLLFIDKNIPA